MYDYPTPSTTIKQQSHPMGTRTPAAGLTFNRWLRLLIALPVFLIPLIACRFGNSALPPSPTLVPATLTPTSTPIAAATVPQPTPTSSLTPVKESTGDTVETQPSTPRTLPTVTEMPEPPATDTPAPTESPPPTEAPTPTESPPPPPLDSLSIRLMPVAGGFSKPLYLTHAGDGSDRLFVVEQAGRIFIIVRNGAVNPTPFLDIVSLVGSDASEQGLLSVAFHPDYADNGLFFVDYTNKQGNTVIARYNVSDNPDLADPNSARILLTIDQPYGNHNGGQLAFGPDSYLYVGMGDGGAANDPHNNGQSLNTLLGKILRLDVNNADPYGIPQNNPFVNRGDARSEIWSYGWRNPWRFSFDVATGDMYIADVGQNQYEEVDVELAGSPGGQNYGWRYMEGRHCFNSQDCDPNGLGLVLPIVEYDHNRGCSITGGYVYRGSQFPALTGTYFYGDYCSGVVWGLRREADGSWSQAELLRTEYGISSFGQDGTGELYLVSHHSGEIFQVGN